MHHIVFLSTLKNACFDFIIKSEYGTRKLLCSPLHNNSIGLIIITLMVKIKIVIHGQKRLIV